MITAVDLLTAHPFLAGMPVRQLERIARYTHRASFHPGTRLFSEGGAADRCWLLREGEVRLETNVPGRGDVEVEILGPGTVVGWSWLFPPYRWNFSAVAADATLAIELDGPGIRRLCAEDPAVGYELTRRFMAVVVERLQATRGRLLEIGRGSVSA